MKFATADKWIFIKIMRDTKVSNFRMQYAVNGAASIYAPFVTADPSNVVGVSRINVPQQNLNAQKTGGVDLEFDYQMPEGLIPFFPGTLGIRALGTWIDNFHSITPTQDIDSVGTISAPKLAFSISVQHEWENWTSVLNVKYQSNVIFSTQSVGLDGLTPGTAAWQAPRLSATGAGCG